MALAMLDILALWKKTQEYFFNDKKLNWIGNIYIFNH